MADPATDTRATEQTASEIISPAVERAGDDERRASTNGFDVVSAEEFFEAVKAHHRENRKLRERERRESDNPTADMINEMRDERDEQILSAVLGIYEEEE